jgi:DNA-binding MarR family transcriptional regulator
MTSISSDFAAGRITDLSGRDEHLAELPDRDADALSAAALVNRLIVSSGLLLHQLDRLLRASGLTAGSYNVLMVIASAEESLTPSEISVRMPVPVTTATMTGVLDTLERRGLVSRHPHPTDRRRVLIELDPDGRALLDAVVPLVIDQQRGWVSSLPIEVRDEICESLSTLERHLRVAKR